MATDTFKLPVRRRGDPPWEIAMIFPEQGYWNEGDYFALPNNRSVEFDNGTIEVLPLPKKTHELIVFFLAKLIEAYVIARALGGIVLPAGYKLRIPNRKFRQADVIYLNADQNAKSNENFADSADLVVEVVSADDPDRDYITKREEYALAGVDEYWIVDPAKGQFLVLRLENGAYVGAGCYVSGQKAVSHRFPDLQVSVDEVMALGR